MKSIALVSLLFVLASTGCKKDDNKEQAGPAKEQPAAPNTDKAAPGPAAKATGDARTVAITVGDHGYEPASIEAAANESLVLEFTRTSEVECGRFVKVEGVEGKTELPLNQKVSIPVTMPVDGELTFACGMGMMTGQVVVAAK